MMKICISRVSGMGEGVVLEGEAGRGGRVGGGAVYYSWMIRNHTTHTHTHTCSEWSLRIVKWNVPYVQKQFSTPDVKSPKRGPQRWSMVPWKLIKHDMQFIVGLKVQLNSLFKKDQITPPVQEIKFGKENGKVVLGLATSHNSK